MIRNPPTRSLAALLALLVPLAPWACRELGEGEDGKGPNLRFVLPAPGDTVPQVFPVELVAEDASGVTEVSLSCASESGAIALLAVWSQGPYRRDVDVSGCAATPEPQGDLSTVALTARARDRQGNASELSTELRVDTQLPALALTLRHVDTGLPLRHGHVPPGALLEAEVVLHGGGPLLGPPILTVDGHTQVTTGPREGPKFLTRFTVPRRTQPQRGLPDGGALDLSLALESEPLLSVSVEGTNERGNHTRVEQVLTVSRILWTSPLPGRPPVNGSSRPQALTSGLLLPLNFDPAQSGSWVPVFVDAELGAPVPIPLPAPVGKNELFLGRKIAEDGTLLVQSTDRSVVLSPTGSPLQTVTPPLPGNAAAASVTQANGTTRFCEPQVLSACQGANYRCAQSAPSTESGFGITLPLGSAGASNTHGAVTAAAGSGENLLFFAYGQQAAPGNTCCGLNMGCSDWLTLVTPSNQTRVWPGSPDEIIPDRGGGFLLRTGSVLEHVRVDPAVPQRSYRAPFSVQGRVLAALPDGTALLALPAPGYTDLFLLGPDAPAPRAQLRLPGFYSQIQATAVTGVPRVFEDFVVRPSSDTEGTLTVVSSSTGAGASLTHRLLHLRYGPDFLELDWMVDFPQGAANPLLVGRRAEAHEPVYLVDTLWQKIYAVLP